MSDGQILGPSGAGVGLPGASTQFGTPPPNSGLNTYAGLPGAASSAVGTPVFTTDAGWVYSNGVTWLPISLVLGTVYFSSALPPASLYPFYLAVTVDQGLVFSNGSTWSTVSAASALVAGVYTFATLPAASANQFKIAITSDQGPVFSNGATWLQLYNQTSSSLAIANNPPLISGSNGTAYSIQLTATGGAPPFSWIKVSQFADTNTWTVSAGGVLACAAPATSTLDNIQVQVTDSTGTAVQKLLTVTISASAGTPAATPTFSPVAGTYSVSQSVVISCASAGVTIYYTTNGSTPTTSSPVYSTPLTVSISQTINAIASGGSFTQSPVGSASYVISAGGFNPLSPRLWAARLQGTGGNTYQNAAYIAWARYRAIHTIGINYTGSSITQFGASGRGGWVDARHADTLVPGGNKIVQYMDPQQYNGTNPTPPAGGDTVHGVLYSHIDANNWLMRVTGTTGALPQNGSYYYANDSTFCPADSNGDKYMTFVAKWTNQCLRVGSGVYQTGFVAADAAPNIDGFYQDDLWYTTLVNASIGRDATTDSSHVATNSGSTPDNRADAWRAGEALWFAQLERDFPGNLRVANVNYFAQILQFGVISNSAIVTGSMNQVLDCPQAQNIFGWGFTEGSYTFAQLTTMIQLYTNMCRPGIASPLLDIGYLSGVGSATYGAAGNGIPGSAPLTWSGAEPSSYTAAYVGMRYYTAWSQIVANAHIGCDGFADNVNTNLQSFDEWGDFGSPGFPPGFAGNLLHPNSDPIQTAAKYGNGIWERRVFIPATGQYGRWAMNPRGNGAQTYNPGVTLYKGLGTQNPSYNTGTSFTTLAMASPDGGFFFESPQGGGGGGGGTQSVLQFLSADVTTSATSTSQAMGTVTVGSTILVLTFTNFTAISSVVDTQGNTYNLVQTAQSAAGPGNQKFYVYAAYNVVGGANTVTVNYGAATTVRPILLLEAGGTAAAPLDGSNHNDQASPGTGAGAVVTGAASNTAQPALALGFTVPIFNTLAPAAVAPYTSQGTFWSASGSTGRCESLALITTASQQATFTAVAGTTEHLSLLIILNHA